MSKLINDFGGLSRFYSKFNNSMFRDANNNLCTLGDSAAEDYDSNTVNCRKLMYTASGKVSARTQAHTVPAAFFTDMGRFATPELGWRSSDGGKFLAYLSRRADSFHRGQAKNNTEMKVSDMSRMLSAAGALNVYNASTYNRLVHMIMEPDHMALTKGLAAIASNKRVSFTVNENVAVVPNADSGFSILYRDLGVIGTIDSDGSIHCGARFISEIISRKESV